MTADGGIGAGPSAMATPPWAVRIKRADGTIAGSGILLSPDRVLTCAHVLGQDEEVTAEFVGAGGGRVVQVGAQVAGDAYRPEQTDEDGDPTGDVALLALDAPRPAGTATQLYRLSAPGRTVDMFGFPTHHNGGMWLPATALGGCGRDGQVQLDPLAPGKTARWGFSGGGVVDRDTGQVVGMVVSKLNERTGGFTYMSPAETVVRHLPEVKAWTAGDGAVDDDFIPRRAGGGAPFDEGFDVGFAERLALWMRGDFAVRGDGAARQVKISLVRRDQQAREAALLRAINLADRELRGSSGYSTFGGPSTVPAAGGLDLAVHAAGRGTEDIAERIARRMGRWGPARTSAVERVGAAGATMTLVVVGVDEAAEPATLLRLLERMAAGGSRVLLVFRRSGGSYKEAGEKLLLRPWQERTRRLAERYAAILAGPGRELGSLTSRVRGPRELTAATDTAVETVIGVFAANDKLTRGKGEFANPDMAKEPVEYEALAERAERRLPPVLEQLRELRDLRDRLAGLLEPLLGLFEQAAGPGEDLEAEGLYLAAHRLLDERPCDVPAAEAAVRAFLDYVHDMPPAPPAQPPVTDAPPGAPDPVRPDAAPPGRPAPADGGPRPPAPPYPPPPHLPPAPPAPAPDAPAPHPAAPETVPAAPVAPAPAPKAPSSASSAEPAPAPPEAAAPDPAEPPARERGGPQA